MRFIFTGDEKKNFEFEEEGGQYELLVRAKGWFYHSFIEIVY